MTQINQFEINTKDENNNTYFLRQFSYELITVGYNHKNTELDVFETIRYTLKLTPKKLKITFYTIDNYSGNDFSYTKSIYIKRNERINDLMIKFREYEPSNTKLFDDLKEIYNIAKQFYEYKE